MHKALILLLSLQILGRVRRLSRNLFSRQKRLVTLLGLLLGVLWLGNAFASLLLREPYAPPVFARAASLGLLGYFLWEVLRVAANRPESPIAWTRAERHHLLGGPFSRRALIAYRIATATTTTFLKAGCVALLFLPELSIWWVGFIGAFLGFLFLEFLRLIVEFIACGVSRSTYRAIRAAVLLLAAAAGCYALVRTLNTSQEPFQGPLAAWSLLQHFGAELVGLRETWIGRGLEAPFVVFARIATAEQVSTELGSWLALGAGMLLAFGWIAFRLDSRFHASGYNSQGSRSESPEGLRTSPGGPRSRHIPRLGGIGPLAWRQFVGARSHTQGLLLAMAAPTVLACLPLSLQLDPATTFANVVGAVGFYSFVLLPAALKFDFRRDFERLQVLKSLPLGSTAVVLGQIAAPVVLTTVYQLLVLAIVCCACPVPPLYLLATMLCLIPANVMIYGFENALFLLSPHRLKQEGIEIFLKTTLTFTAKGLVFAAAAVTVFWWVFLAASLADSLKLDRLTVFVAGLTAICWLAAAGATSVLAHTYSRVDASPSMAD